ncbi:hypothetical protein DKG71_41460 [Streptomyces sp. NEAU-S7GS2]|nr:hypothetical protein DKG71_41460 [Streptomyces sp. NEAU-S7GS2]
MGADRALFPDRSKGAGGDSEPIDHAFGRSRDWLTTSIHLAADPGRLSALGPAHFPGSIRHARLRTPNGMMFKAVGSRGR